MTKYGVKHLKLKELKGAIDVGDPKDVEVVEDGGPCEAFGLDLNKPIEVDKYKTPLRKFSRRKIIIEETLLQKLILMMKASSSLGELRWKIQKRKYANYEAHKNLLEGLDKIAQTSLKMEETRSQTTLKHDSIGLTGS